MECEYVECANYPYTCSWELSWIAKDTAQRDEVEGFLKAPTAATYCSPSRSTATMEEPVRVNLTHPVNIPCAGKPEYLEKTRDFRQSID